MGGTNDASGRASRDHAISNPEVESARADAFRRLLAGRLLLCNVDELRVIDALLSRVELGRERYGYLDISAARDWEREEHEEHLDSAIYRTIGKLKHTDEQIAIIERATQPAKRGKRRK